jgi:hypothetical protein
MEHLTEKQVEAYHTQSLSGGELLGVSEHLVRCETCRARVLGGKDLAAGAGAVHACLSSEPGAGAHLTYDEIAAYVDGRMGHAEASMVELHARECGACATDLREIRDLKTLIDRARPAVARRGRLFGSWRAAFGWRAVLACAAAAACAALVAVVIHNRAVNPTARVEAPAQSPSPQERSSPVAAIARLRDGDRLIALSADGALTGLDGLPDRYRAAVSQALTTRRVETADTVSELSARRGVLLGSPTARASLDLLEPIGTVVESQHPIFRWTPVSGAEYRVAVFDGEFQQAAGSDWMQEPQWESPRALRRGARYSWQVTVRQNGEEFTAPAPPAPEAAFQVLGASAENELAQLRNAWGESHLVMGLAYARAGLLDEAKRQFQAVADQNPGSPDAAALLASLNRLPVSPGRRQSR